LKFPGVASPSIITSVFGTYGCYSDRYFEHTLFSIITYSLASMPAGILSDKIGRRNVIVEDSLFSLLFILVLPWQMKDICLDIVCKSMVFTWR